jgi:hypothetical protein
MGVIPRLRRRAGGLGLIVGAALAGCGSSASQEPPGTPVAVEPGPNEAAQRSAPQPESPAPPAPNEPAKSEATTRGAPDEESREAEQDNFGTDLRDLLIARQKRSRRVAECNRLIRVMNREGEKLSIQGSATDPSAMFKVADDLEAAGRAIQGVKLSVPEMVSFRDRSAGLFRDVARSARSSGDALHLKDLMAATKALNELTANATANASLVSEINAYCGAE